MALAEKGILDNQHYDVLDIPPTTNMEPSAERARNRDQSTTNWMDGYDDTGRDEGEGIHL